MDYKDFFIDELKNQNPHWEKTYIENMELFGEKPSEPAIRAEEIFKDKEVKEIIELGGGQGRDTIFFARKGYSVTVVDYTDTGINTINKKAEMLGLTDKIKAIKCDVKTGLPFKKESFDACYSHMLYCMAFTTNELNDLCKGIWRILRIEGMNFYTARNEKDSHYRQGIHRGEDMYEINGFIVHFFDKNKIEQLSTGFEIQSITEFEEGELPRKLYQVLLRKTQS